MTSENTNTNQDSDVPLSLEERVSDIDNVQDFLVQEILKLHDSVAKLRTIALTAAAIATDAYAEEALKKADDDKNARGIGLLVPTPEMEARIARMCDVHMLEKSVGDERGSEAASGTPEITAAGAAFAAAYLAESLRGCSMGERSEIVEAMNAGVVEGDAQAAARAVVNAFRSLTLRAQFVPGGSGA